MRRDIYLEMSHVLSLIHFLILQFSVRSETTKIYMSEERYMKDLV